MAKFSIFLVLSLFCWSSWADIQMKCCHLESDLKSSCNRGFKDVLRSTALLSSKERAFKYCHSFKKEKYTSIITSADEVIPFSHYKCCHLKPGFSSSCDRGFEKVFRNPKLVERFEEAREYCLSFTKDAYTAVINENSEATAISSQEESPDPAPAKKPRVAK